MISEPDSDARHGRYPANNGRSITSDERRKAVVRERQKWTVSARRILPPATKIIGQKRPLVPCVCRVAHEF